MTTLDRLREEVEEIKGEHLRLKGGMCDKCDHQDWPCDARRLADGWLEMLTDREMDHASEIALSATLAALEGKR